MAGSDRKPSTVWRDRGLLVPGAAILTPIVVAYSLLVHFMFSFPWQDDYRAILDFGLHYKQTGTLSAGFKYILASQHVDYKLIFEHSLIALQLALLGHVNFTSLLVAGDVFLLGILFAVWQICLPQEADFRRRLLLFVPVGFLLFSLNYSETLDWAMACLQNLPVIFFSLITLDLLFSNNRWEKNRITGDLSRSRFALACLTAVLASLSSANGFLMGPIGLFLLIFRREVWRSVCWCLLFPLLAAAYLYKYQVALPTMVVPLYTKPLFMLAVIGDAAPPRLIIPFGLFILCIWGWSLHHRYFNVNPSAFAVSVWLIATALMIAAGRGNFGLQAAYASRYKIYSDLFLIFCYGFGVDRVTWSGVSATRSRHLYQAATAFAVLYCMRSDVSAWRLLKQRKADADQGMAAWRQDPSHSSPMFISDVVVQQAQKSEDEVTRRILNEAVATGLYKPEP